MVEDGAIGRGSNCAVAGSGYGLDVHMKVLGRIASQIATVVQGKDKPTYAPNRDDGDMCIVLNAKDVCVTGRKLTDKVYYWHTGYVGHLKERTLKDQMAKDPTEVIRKAVLRMLPRNNLRDVTLMVSNTSSNKSLSASKSNAGNKYVRQVTGCHNDTELHLAAQCGDVEAVRQILNVIHAHMVGTLSSTDFDVEVAEIRSAIVNYVNELGETTLFIAADKEHFHVVKELLQHASPEGISLKNDLGFDPFHLAARQGHDVVKLLLEKDPQLARRTDKKCQTALHMAVKGVSCEVVKLILLADAAIVMLPDKFGNTALRIATRKKRIEVSSLQLLMVMGFHAIALTFMRSRPGKLLQC